MMKNKDEKIITKCKTILLLMSLLVFTIIKQEINEEISSQEHN